MIYIISPADLIPAPILGFSLIDDAVMLIYLLSIVESKTKKYYGDNFNNKGKKYKENVKEEDIIENVEYKVHKEGE